MGKKKSKAEESKQEDPKPGKKPKADKSDKKPKADKPAKENPAVPQELGRKDYEKRLRKLHVELVKMQEYIKAKGLKVCIIFEGRDGAGKGGTIKALTERVSPRVFRVVALPAPNEREKSQIYMQRYIPHLPAAGEVVIFDRSWYNRAGVERVLGFCTEEQSLRFLASIPGLEKALVESGIILIKYWLEVSPDEQARRLEDRITDGRKTWKLSPMDLKSFDKWDEYTKARDDMFASSDTAWAPWFVANSDDKQRLRLNVLAHILSRVPYKDLKPPSVKLPKRKIHGGAPKASMNLKFVPDVTSK